jgi:hypothetical protein
LAAGAIGLFVLVVYRITSAPTASFWDCGELIACSYTLGIPHPPGTPLFVLLGRLFALLPVAREPAARIGFLTSLFSAISCSLAYLLIVKLVKGVGSREQGGKPNGKGQVGGGESADTSHQPPATSHYSYLPHFAGLCGALALGFAFSVWDNAVETEVYGPVTMVALLVMLWAVNWREKVEQGISDNRLVLASIFLILLSAGLHFTPMLALFALLVFWLVVERRSVLDLRLIEFFGGFLIILTLDSMAGRALPLKLVVAVVLLGLLFLGVWLMERSARTRAVFWGLLALAGMLVVAYFAGLDPHTGRDLIVDDLVLFLASPTSALVERWLANWGLVVGFVAAYAGYLIWLKTRNRLDTRYVALGLFLILLAGTVQYFLIVRARTHPLINEADPSSWSNFVSVLKREQYDPMKLYPRKTMFMEETDYFSNRNPQLGLLAGYFEQIKLYVRYLLWQWAGPDNLDMVAYSRNWFFPFQRFNPLPALVGLIITAFGVIGIADQWRRDKRTLLLIGVAFLVSSLGLLTYLNLKISPSDPRNIFFGAGEGMHFVEVRERDYFFAFSFVFYAVFIGLGVHAFLHWLKTRTKHSRGGFRGAVTVVLLLVMAPILFNFRSVSRIGDWIPAEYGYDMLASCDDGGVLFTNGDNDTFPLWFVQMVPTRVAGYRDGFKKPVKPGKGVMVANLSLINTDWYVRQMIEWGAPLSFSAAALDSLPTDGYYSMPDNSFLFKDLVIRDMLATNTGMKLRWGKEFMRVPDPRGEGFVGVGVHDDEYETARAEYDTLTRAASSAQAFLAASTQFGAWCLDHRFSIAGIELAARMPRYQALAVQRAGPDTIARERQSFAKWLERGDYGMPSSEFVKYVVANYHGRRPIYFSTTVQEDYLVDVRKGDSLYLSMEGLVQRVVNRPGPAEPRERSMDGPKTAKLLDSVYVLTSMSDKRVKKDENSRGMFTNFLLAGVKLADQYYGPAGQYGRARATLRHIAQMDFDPDQRVPLYEGLYRFSYLAEDYPAALAYLDSLRMTVTDAPTLQHLVFQRSFLSQLQGDFAGATGLISSLATRVSQRNIVTVFDTIYAGYARYKGFPAVHSVLDRWRVYNPRDSMPVWIGRGLDEVEKLSNQVTKEPRNQGIRESRGKSAVPRIPEPQIP